MHIGCATSYIRHYTCDVIDVNQIRAYMTNWYATIYIARKSARSAANDI